MGRGDAQRIYQAQRVGIFARLVKAERVNELEADHWIGRWEREAEASGPARCSQHYWDEAWDSAGVVSVVVSDGGHISTAVPPRSTGAGAAA